MGRHTMDMGQEKEKSEQEVFAEGWHDFEVVSMEEATSKQGNPMFKISLALADNPTKGIVVYAILSQGKRWLLKQLLDACGCEAGQDKVYDFDTDDIIGKTVSGRIENQNENWVDRNGKERKTIKSKIMAFSAMKSENIAQEEGPEL